MRSRGWFLLFERSAFSICKITFFSETANDYGKKFVILHAVMEKEATRPLILISNDDGYAAKGINDLIEMVRPMGDVLVCAPDGPRSGQACALTRASTFIILGVLFWRNSEYKNQKVNASLCPSVCRSVYPLILLSVCSSC